MVFRSSNSHCCNCWKGVSRLAPVSPESSKSISVSLSLSLSLFGFVWVSLFKHIHKHKHGSSEEAAIILPENSINTRQPGPPSLLCVFASPRRELLSQVMQGSWAVCHHGWEPVPGRGGAETFLQVPHPLNSGR